MIIVVLLVLGLCLGSFVNALVWRLHEQDRELGKKQQNRRYLADLSISRGRSMCTHCHHELAAKDLVPLFSWLSLAGKCRYCHKPIGKQYPFVEALTAALFIVSYVYWPMVLQGLGRYLFIFWLLFVVAFVALAVYDLRWQLLPNRLVFPLIGLALLQLAGQLIIYHGAWELVTSALWGVLICSGIFYVLFQLSAGRWIGGGDVKLGVVLGLLVGGPLHGLLLLFIASLLGSVVSIPLLLAGKRHVKIPFGPFLLAATVIVVLFGTTIIDWYTLQITY